MTTAMGLPCPAEGAMWLLQLPAGKSKGSSPGTDDVFLLLFFRKALITHWPLVFFVNAKQKCLKCEGICVVCEMQMFLLASPVTDPFSFFLCPSSLSFLGVPQWQHAGRLWG